MFLGGENMTNPIYLDYCANYPVKKEVLDELCASELKFYGNANSSHQAGILAHQYVEQRNEVIRKCLNLPQDMEIIHTSSATESNNMAIKGIVDAYSAFGNKILVSELEHNSINGCLSTLKDKGYQIDFIKTESNGLISIDDFKAKLNSSVILVVATALDSELGSLQKYNEIALEVKKYPHAHYLCDVTQAIAKYEISFENLELVSFTPHKFGGLTGTGVLLKKKSIVIMPLINGGSSLTVYRSGSIPVGLISSTAKACEIMTCGRADSVLKLKRLSELFLKLASLNKNIQINSFENLFIFNIGIKNHKASDVVSYLSEHNIYVSQKSACSIKNTPSKIVMSVYHDKKRALESFRVSISENTTDDEIRELFKVLEEI